MIFRKINVILQIISGLFTYTICQHFFLYNEPNWNIILSTHQTNTGLSNLFFSPVVISSRQPISQVKLWLGNNWNWAACCFTITFDLTSYTSFEVHNYTIHCTVPSTQATVLEVIWGLILMSAWRLQRRRLASGGICQFCCREALSVHISVTSRTRQLWTQRLRSN